jgi:hypothetical protein
MAPMSRFSATVSVGNALARPAGDVHAAEGDAPAQLRAHAGERADERCLAGAVGADDGDDRALLDVERHAVERLHVAVEHIQVLDVQHHTTSAPR